MQEDTEENVGVGVAGFTEVFWVLERLHGTEALINLPGRKKSIFVMF